MDDDYLDAATRLLSEQHFGVLSHYTLPETVIVFWEGQ
jgi:hypothetical protein